MTPLLQNLLIAHVIFGILGVGAVYGVWMGFMKHRISWKFLQCISFLGFLFFVLSWVSGGYYYATYYGKAVKPVIQKGAYPWAHAFIMEFKEHAFLLLPFLAAVIFLTLWLGRAHLEQDERAKRAFVRLVGFTALLSIVIAASGILISGAVR